MENKPLTGIVAKLARIQRRLNAPKNQRNEFGKYTYRSCEDILEALKSPLADEACAVLLHDEILQIGDRYYIQATATLLDADGDDPISVSAMAREADQKKGMDPAQLSGATSSYARKYALNGLFSIDDCKDADTMDNREQSAIKREHEEVETRKAIETPPERYDQVRAEYAVESHAETLLDDVESNTDESQFSDQYEPGAVYEATKSALAKFCTDSGFKKSDVNNWIKREYGGQTIAKMKNDDGLLIEVLANVRKNYRPKSGDSIAGYIPGKVV